MLGRLRERGSLVAFMEYQGHQLNYQTYAANGSLACDLANRPILASPHPFKAISTGSRVRPSGDR